MRLGLLLVFDDIDRDGRLTLGDDGQLAAPDRLLAQSALMRCYMSPASRPIRARWMHRERSSATGEMASAHYNLVGIDSSPVYGHIVDPGSTVVFIPARGAPSL